MGAERGFIEMHAEADQGDGAFGTEVREGSRQVSKCSPNWGYRAAGTGTNKHLLNACSLWAKRFMGSSSWNLPTCPLKEKFLIPLYS